MKIVIDIDDDLYVRLFDNGGNNVMDMRRACVSIRKGIPIPDNATNGDVMKIIFPKIGVYDEWYDEPYQKGVIQNG